MTKFIDYLLQILRLPQLPTYSPLFRLGYYAEFIFAIAVLLLIINLVRKIFIKDNFFTGWTTFLLVLVLVTGGIFILCWQVPDVVARGWMLMRPHMSE